MLIHLSKLLKALIVSWLIFSSFQGYSQAETSRWKAFFQLGLAMPESMAYEAPQEVKSVNFPNITLGVQHQFKALWGLRLDYQYNRFKSSDQSPEFKTNLSRLNAQLIFDSAPLKILPKYFSIVAHMGPGYTFMKPLGQYKDYKKGFFNLLGGLEFH